MDVQEFRQQAHQMVDWMADYLGNIESFPVKSQVSPREVYDALPKNAPDVGESMKAIFSDFQQQILPGITHWQSPNFYAYFPGNSSYPSILAEMLTATLGAQCMIWDTSPAAAELEEKTMNWLKDMLGLPNNWEGVIQSTASDATLCAILTAREVANDFHINQKGFQGHKTYRVYCSSQTHSSIDKAVKIAGIGQENTVHIAVDDAYAMDPHALEHAILQDKDRGYIPLCVVGTLGTTSSTAMDPLAKISEICTKYGIWFHVDGAFAGTAMLLPELRHLFNGLETADSFVFNPHKWMFTNFDCSAYFVKDKAALIQTFEILPEYLKTAHTQTVNNYRDWGIPLGRRFRALKLWFVIRSYGVYGLTEKIRHHIDLAQTLRKKIIAHPEFEMLAPTPLNLLCFRYHPSQVKDEATLNSLNQTLLEELNATGKLFLTHTKLKGSYTLRLCIGNTHVEERHVSAVWELVQKMAENVFVQTKT